MPSFPNIPGGPVWDWPLRRGIKPEERADDIRPYGRVENRDGGRMISAPTESPWPGIRRAHNMRPYGKTENHDGRRTMCAPAKAGRLSRYPAPAPTLFGP